MSMNHSSFARIFRIDELLRAGRFHSVEFAAKELDVSKRTIERDIEKMRYELGAEIRYNRKFEKYEYLGDSVTLPAGWLNENEIAVILIAERALRMYTQTPFSDDIHPAFNKMLNPVKHKQDMMESIRDKCRSVYFHRPFEFYNGLRNEFSKILNAIMNRKRVSFKYPSKKDGRMIKREVEPYSVVNNNGEWQVIARSVKQRRIKTFALRKISEPRGVDFFYDIPGDYDVRDYIYHPFENFRGDGLRDIELNIEPPASKRIGEVLWHESQVLRSGKEDDSINLKMRCCVNNALIDWVFSMQECVEVVKPEELRAVINKKARAMAERNMC